MDEYNLDENTKKRLSSFFMLIGGVMFGDVKKVEKMLDQGTDVNGRIIDIDFNYEKDSESGSTITDTDTPLLVAVKSSALPKIVQLLLERGADVTVKDENGKIPLEIAKERKLTDVVNLLEIHGTHK
jgi:hypothetical protein